MGNPYNERTYRALAESFLRTTGEAVRIAMSPREGDEIVRSLLLRSFTGSPLPDVAFLNGDVIRSFAERRLVVALEPLMSEVDRTTMRTIRIGSRIHGIAFGLSVPIVAFNAELTRRASVSPTQLPRDWPGVLALARRIHSAGRNVTGGFIEHDNGGAFTFQYLLGSYGVQPMSTDETQLALRTPAAVEAMQVLRGFGECGQATADMSRRQARRAFAHGRIGVLVTMSSVIPYLESTSAGEFPVLVTPLPIADERAHIPAAGPVAVVMTQDPDRQRRAWQFVRHAVGPAGQAILVKTSGYLAAENIPTPGLPTATPLSARVDPTRVCAWYTFPGRNSLKISELIQDEMQQIATLQKTPENAVEDIVRAVEPLLARRG